MEFLIGRPGVDGGAVVAEGVVQRLDPVQQRVGDRMATEGLLECKQNPSLLHYIPGLATQKSHLRLAGHSLFETQE